MNWSEWFYYDETSTTCLRWKVDVRSGKNLSTCKIREGMQAGSQKANKRPAQVSLSSKGYTVSRIIWEIHYGEIQEGMVIDHLNRDATDNRISNLRMVTQVVNCRNLGRPKNNVSGKVGVSKMHTDGLEYWVASWRCVTGKFKQKCFSVKKLGDAEAFQKASEYRDTMLSQLNLLGAGYTATHGKESNV